MLRLVAIVFLICNLCACECCPETGVGYNKNACPCP